MSEDPMYYIGYEDGWAGRDVHPEFAHNRAYDNGWREGRALFIAQRVDDDDRGSDGPYSLEADAWMRRT